MTPSPQSTLASAPASFLVDSREASRLCGLGKTAWYALLAAGRCPLPVRLGRAVRWNRAELEAWAAAGCPARDRWHSMKGSKS
jgi:predicted DNA-binding transcriptional regulator AlpA